MRVLPQPRPRLRPARRWPGHARRPRFVAAGRARRSVADLSGAPAEFQHRPRAETRTIISLAWRRWPRSASRRARAKKTATQTAAAAANIVPQGGLFWDGRADTLQDQALFPLLDPHEMDGGSIENVAEKLRRAPYAERFVGLFGAAHLQQSALAGLGGDVRRRALSVRRPEVPPLHQQVRLLAGGQGAAERERVARLAIVQRP